MRRTHSYLSCRSQIYQAQMGVFAGGVAGKSQLWLYRFQRIYQDEIILIAERRHVFLFSHFHQLAIREQQQRVMFVILLIHAPGVRVIQIRGLGTWVVEAHGQVIPVPVFI